MERNTQPRLKRRVILGTLGAAATVYTLYLAKGSPNEGSRLPDSAHPDVFLKETVVALDEKGLDYSFQEKAGFTRAMFDRVRRGAVMIGIGVTDELTGANRPLSASGYVIRSNQNTVDILTAKHAVVGKINTFRAWRPNIDTGLYIPPLPQVFSTPGPGLEVDLALVRCQGAYPSRVPLESIGSQKKADLRNRDVLVVGFPFPEGTDLIKSRILGGVMKIFESGTNEGEFIAQGFSTSRSSGSPVFILEDGQPKLAGVVFAIKRVDVPTKSGQIQTQWCTLIRTLNDVIPL